MTMMNTLYVVLFSINSLASIVAASLTGAEWSQFTPTQKFVLITLIVGNWTNALLALMQNLAKKIKQGKDFVGDDNTQTFKKDETKPTTPSTT